MSENESPVAAGHDPNSADDDGWTLFLARSAAAIRTLLRLGADPGNATRSGETALMALARIGSPDAVEALVTIGRPNGKGVPYGPPHGHRIRLAHSNGQPDMVSNASAS